MGTEERYAAYDGESLSWAIAAIRRRRGWTQQDLADWTGLNRTYVSTLESGDLAQQVERMLSVVSTLGYELRLVPRRPGPTASADRARREGVRWPVSQR